MGPAPTDVPRCSRSENFAPPVQQSIAAACCSRHSNCAAEIQSADLAVKCGGDVRDFRDAVPDAPVVEDYSTQSHLKNCKLCSKYPESLFTNLHQPSQYTIINAQRNARMHARCVDWNDLAFVCPAVTLRERGPQTQTVTATCIRDR